MDLRSPVGGPGWPRGVAIGAQTLGDLTSLVNTYKEQSWQDKAQMVQFCKLEKMYAADQKRIVMAVERAEMGAQILAALKQLGREQKFGRAPPGAMEWELQEWVEELLRQ